MAFVIAVGFARMVWRRGSPRPGIAAAYANRPLEGAPYRIATTADASGKNTPPVGNRTV